MKLDVVIPTFNRARLMPRALDSLLAAPAPSELEVSIVVVDNNSTDDTRKVVAAYAARSARPIHYVLEKQQGSSAARNAGIRASNGDLVGMIDDDEEIDSEWFNRIYSAFQDPTLDFIGGACLPRWESSPPPWLPRDYPAIVGWIESSPTVREYGQDFAAMLMGGNAVIRRSVFEKVGLFATHLGRSDSGVGCGEDEDLFLRLMAARARGLYLPDLIIYHFVPQERATKAYHRRWCFWWGVSMAARDRVQSQPVPYFLGAPRWMFANALAGLSKRAKCCLRLKRDPAECFSSELPAMDLLGYLYGKHFSRNRKG